MSGFLRPEVSQVLTRWREVIAALVMVALGVWIALRPGPIVQGFGYVLIAVGLAFGFTALRRARFASGGDGPGVVRVDEGRVLYMGPVTGGTIALREMTSLAIRRDHLGARAWVLTEPGQLLVIPVDASGAEALFDAFTTLDGLQVHDLMSALKSTEAGSRTIWRRGHVLALTD